MRKLVSLFLTVTVLLSLCAGLAVAEEKSVLRIACETEPAHLDTQVITNDTVSYISQHIFETLYTYDENYNVVPMLAEGETVSEDGKIVTITLRQGVKFHNGKDMTSEDVYASLDRWLNFGSRASQMKSYVEKLEVVDAYTIRITFTQPYSAWKNLFAFINGGPAIYTAEAMEGADKTALSEEQYIGTGPYRFVTHEAARYYLLEKFADYVPRNEEASGLSGARIANIDELQFIPVSNASTRINGLLAGDYDYIRIATGDMYYDLSGNSKVVVTVNKGSKMPLMFFNSKDRVFATNYALRRAVLAALDMEEILAIAIGPDELWQSNGSINPSWNQFFSEEGIELYNSANPELARTMAKEAGYNGEEIVILINNSHQMHIDCCTVIEQQLEKAGFNVTCERLDAAAQQAKRADETQWDIHFTHHIFSPEPIIYNWMNSGYAGWWDTDEKKELVSEYVGATSDADKISAWIQIQKLTYEQIPIIKLGDTYEYDVYAAGLMGFDDSAPIWPHFWGISK